MIGVKMELGTYFFKDDLFYSKTHEWLKIEKDICFVGIDDYSQRETGEIAYIEPPAIGVNVKQFQFLCEIESVKTVLDIYSPISGEVVETNREIENSPDLLNTDPYSSWICKIKPSNIDEKINLMGIKEYIKYLKEMIDK